VQRASLSGHVISLVSLTSLITAAPVSAQAPPRTVRVSTTGSIGTVRSLTITGAGAWRLIDLGDRHPVCQGSGPFEWRFGSGSGRRLTASGAVGGSSEGWTKLEADGFRLEGGLADALFTVTGGKQTRVYPGAVEVLPVQRGSSSGLRLINEAPMEQYLGGVVTAEGSARFHPEALKALAIAARSYAERNRLRHFPEGELCDTVHCQVYPGVASVPTTVARAVADTSGVVALFGSEVIDAVFSADCGGRTRNSEEVWPNQSPMPYLRSVEDRPPAGGPDYCATYRNHVLRLQLTPSQIGGLLGVSSLQPGQWELQGVERDSSGRVAAVRVRSLAGSRTSGVAVAASSVGRTSSRNGDELLPCELSEAGSPRSGSGAVSSESSSITASRLRQLLGSQLRGRIVGVSPAGDGGLELECRGWGHGVGLCQWGAQGMALPPFNHTYDQILRHYYTGINLGPTPVRQARLTVQLERTAGQPFAGVAVRLLPVGPSGVTDSRGYWQTGPLAEGTYVLEARNGAECATFHALRVIVGKSAQTRLALVWREANPRVARGSAAGPGN
jgi:SpoIID/LytB domain protein